jgi:signal transduction histidine kinase
MTTSDNPEKDNSKPVETTEEETVAEMARRLASRNRELVEQASKLEAVLNGIADGVIVLNMKDQVVTSNPAAEKILADMSGNFQSGPLRELPNQLFRTVLSANDGEKDIFNTRRFRVGGRVLSSTAAPVKDPDGTLLGTVLVLRDITREAEAETLKDSFIASISHELRTPLTAIRGYSELLIQLHHDDPEGNSLRFAKAINHNTAQLMQHINGLIDMTHIQAGDLNLVKEYIFLESIVIDVVNRWRPRMEGKGLHLEVEVTDEHLPVYGDRNRLYWAIQNLFSNAYNYTLKDDFIIIRAYRDGDEGRVDVEDTGVGIAANDQQYLFSRFFRARNELTFGVPGVGLGLFITRSIVEAHDGRVWVDSDLGVGTTFYLALPLRQRDNPAI